MNRYRQLTSGERHALSALRKQGCNQAAFARALGRHRSTISREVRRNSKDRQGRAYRPDLADSYARWRRGRSRRNERFGACEWRIRMKPCRVLLIPVLLALYAAAPVAGQTAVSVLAGVTSAGLKAADAGRRFRWVTHGRIPGRCGDCSGSPQPRNSSWRRLCSKGQKHRRSCGRYRQRVLR